MVARQKWFIVEQEKDLETEGVPLPQDNTELEMGHTLEGTSGQLEHGARGFVRVPQQIDRIACGT